MREFRFYGWYFIIYIFIALITYISLLTIELIKFHAEENSHIWTIIIYFSLIPGTYIFSRLSVLFPATAINQRNSIQWAWSITKGNGWKLFVLLGLLPLLSRIILRMIPETSIHADAVLYFISLIFAVIELALISHTYKFLAAEQTNPPTRDESHIL
jgi:hypothetical protein